MLVQNNIHKMYATSIHDMDLDVVHNILTFMLLVANLANWYKMMRKLEKLLKP